MTNREFFTKVIEEVENEELVAYAERAIEKLDEKNAKRKVTPTKTQKENMALKDEIITILTENGTKVASEIATIMSITTQKASALCRQLVEDGKLLVGERKVKGKGKVKEYSLAEETETETEE